MLQRLLLLIGSIANGILFSMLAAIFYGTLIGLLWNWLLVQVAILGTPLVTISWFQAWGLSLLTLLLFGRGGRK